MGEAPMSTVGTAVEQPTNTQRLQRAIESLRNVEAHLEELKNLVGIPVDQQPDNIKPHEMSIVELFDVAPNELASLEDRLHASISKIHVAIRGY